jgi:hypothetical protein
LRVLRLYDRLNQKTAIQFVDYALERLPFRVEVIQTDNGSEFQAAFHWHVLDKGIGHVYIKPMRPRLNGKVERSHRIDAEEFYRLLNGVVIDDAEIFNQKLLEWEHFYNYARPHGALGGQTPYERLRQRTTLDVSHPRQSHNHRLTSYVGFLLDFAPRCPLFASPKTLKACVDLLLRVVGGDGFEPPTPAL